MLEVGADGVILWADGEARRLLGEDVLGRNVDVFGPEGHEAMRAEFMEAPSAKTMVNRVIEAKRLDGAKVRLHVGLLPISGGRVTVVVSHADSRIVETPLWDALEQTATRMEKIARNLL